MQVKTNTKERFHVITLQESVLTADMAADLDKLLMPYLQNDALKSGGGARNIILNLKELHSLDDSIAEKLVKLQQIFYENNLSFVICEIPDKIESFFDSRGLLELMNTTPTEAEAGDIVRMEEIERDLLDNGT